MHLVLWEKVFGEKSVFSHRYLRVRQSIQLKEVGILLCLRTLGWNSVHEHCLIAIQVETALENTTQSSKEMPGLQVLLVACDSQIAEYNLSP